MALLAFISKFAKPLLQPALGHSNVITKGNTRAGLPHANLQAGTTFSRVVSTRSWTCDLTALQLLPSPVLPQQKHWQMSLTTQWLQGMANRLLDLQSWIHCSCAVCLQHPAPLTSKPQKELQVSRLLTHLAAPPMQHQHSLSTLWLLPPAKLWAAVASWWEQKTT